jgi:hypothetical protein
VYSDRKNPPGDGRQGLDQELGPDDRMSHAGAEADPDIVNQRGPIAVEGIWGVRLLAPDCAQQERRGHEGQEVEDDRQRSCDGLHQDPTQSRPDDLGDRFSGLQLRVALDETVLADECRQVGVICNLKQGGGGPTKRGDKIELSYAQSPQPHHQWQGQRQARAD